MTLSMDSLAGIKTFTHKTLQLTFTYSKLTIEKLEEDVKYI